MTVEELKKMSDHEVKNFIRQRLMYTQEEIKKAQDTISFYHPAYNLICDIRPNITLHHRFDMSEDKEYNNELLARFDDLRLMKSFYDARLTFHKGCADFEWCNNRVTGVVHEENLCGEGTVYIIHFIMSKAWGLKL